MGLTLGRLLSGGTRTRQNLLAGWTTIWGFWKHETQHLRPIDCQTKDQPLKRSNDYRQQIMEMLRGHNVLSNPLDTPDWWNTTTVMTPNQLCYPRMRLFMYTYKHAVDPRLKLVR